MKQIFTETCSDWGESIEEEMSILLGLHMHITASECYHSEKSVWKYLLAIVTSLSSHHRALWHTAAFGFKHWGDMNVTFAVY